MQDILDLIEPDFEVKSVILLPDAPRACDSCQSSVSGSPMLFSSGSWHPELLSGYAERSELHQTSYPRFPQ